MASYRNRLLAATPTLSDSNFALTVVLVLEHDADGAFGIVLNRPSTMPLPESLSGWAQHACAPAVLFVGGPVQPDVVLLVGRAEGAERDPAGPAPLPPGLTLADPDVPPELATVTDVRAFAGYAGWGPGQLDREVSGGGWFAVDLEEGDVLSPAPETLWTRVLRRQGGLLTTITPDPTAN